MEESQNLNEKLARLMKARDEVMKLPLTIPNRKYRANLEQEITQTSMQIQQINLEYNRMNAQLPINHDTINRHNIMRMVQAKQQQFNPMAPSPFFRQQPKKRYLKPGQANIFIGYFTLAVMLVFLFGVCIPFMMTWYVQMHVAGQSVLAVSNINSTLNSLPANDTVAPVVKGVFLTAQESNANSTEILGFFYKYSWIIIIVVITFSLFMYSRRLVETQQIV